MKRQNGVTLMELLASITLLGIMSILIFSIIHLSFKSDENITENINLTTEANQIMSQIEKAFYTNNTLELQKKNGLLQVKSDGKWTTITDKDFENIDLTINETPIHETPKTFQTTNKTGLSIRLFIAGKTDILTIETTLKRYQHPSMNIKE